MTTVSAQELNADLPVRAVGLGAATPIIASSSTGRRGLGGARGRQPGPVGAARRPTATAIAVVTRGVDPDWPLTAACREVDPELFHPDFSSDTAVATAKRVCQRCPVRDPCLRVGLANNDRKAILGNTSPSERAPLHYAQACESFKLAGRIGRTAAARELKVGLHVLYGAWDLWGLGRPPPPAQVVTS